MSIKVTLRIFRCFVFLLAFFCLAVGRGHADPSGCESAPWLTEQDQSILGLHEAGQTGWFRVQVPAAGYLLVEVRAAGGEPQPILGLWGSQCLGREGGSARVLERGTNHMTLRVEEPGSWLFRVGPEDPSSVLGQAVISSRFAPSFLETLAAGAGEDEEELEIDPGSLRIDPSFPRHQGEERLAEMAICAGFLGEDDHGDMASCATSLSVGVVQGVIDSSRRRDVDFFRFNLPEEGGRTWWQVELHGIGSLVSLLDDQGNHLALHGGRGVVGEFRFARALAPGTYYLRVGGSEDVDEAYSLELAATSW